ncbi:glutathione S-transferase [Paraglaciecola sp. 20A4]|uniref:glutathione S-transferase family protein n=1 Tax=Paraglaciecola sp. 20A4 TaxID=2687288 RepID=UPI001409B5EC|nr:glutathione S-transferase [Paraglaciecola sp. 20A4]
MYKLYGSTTSPYVRRLRIWLANTQHEFINMQIFESEDRTILITKNPALKVPALEHIEGDKSTLIYDSRVIYRYLVEQLNYASLSWEQENQLTLIDSVNDSLVQMFLLSKSDVIADTEKLFFKLQKERVNNVLAELNEHVERGKFNSWNYPAICLFSLIDWIEFRSLHNLKGLSALLDFHQENAPRIEVTATDPRM